MSDPRFPAGHRVRTDVVFASNAPLAVILRRGPRRHYRLLTWSLRTDAILPGQWMKGIVRLFDLTPDGSRLLYWAAQHHAGAGRRPRLAAGPYDPASDHRRGLRAAKRGRRRIPRYLRGDTPPGAPPPRRLETTWTAISTPPYFSALAIWPSFGYWTGGGAFRPDGAICLFESSDGMTPIANTALPASLRIERVTEADWQRGAALYAARRPLPEASTLNRVVTARLTAAGARLVDWVAPQGDDLLFACDGRVHRLPDWTDVAGAEYLTRSRCVVDLNGDRFELIPPPAEAMQW